MQNIEYQLNKKIKYVLIAIVFGVFGLHRFIRHQYISAVIYLVTFGMSVLLIGNPGKVFYVTFSLTLLFSLALIDALSMAISGRFYLDEKNVKVSSFNL